LVAEARDVCEWVMSACCAPASKPGGDLLFHRLSDSTIGAVRFHGRVRDGIGWVTDAMATKLWGRRSGAWSLDLWSMRQAPDMLGLEIDVIDAEISATVSDSSAVVDGGTLKRE
jgi:hypothetical protein